MTTHSKQPPAKPVSAVTSSMQSGRGRHLSVVTTATENSGTAHTAAAQFPLLAEASRHWAIHRPLFNPGKWDDPFSLAGVPADERPELAATQIRHFGTDDSLPGVDADIDLAYRKKGYRRLVDGVRQNDQLAPTLESRATTTAFAEFGADIEIRNLSPDKESRLEFTALAGRLNISIGTRFILQPIELGGATGFALVQTEIQDDERHPIASLKSKHRLAFNTPARGAIEVQWELPFERCEFTVIGRGVHFVVALTGFNRWLQHTLVGATVTAR